MKEGDSVAIRIMIDLRANLKGIYDDILEIISEDIAEGNRIKNKVEKEETKSFSQTPTLNQFGVDLCENAKKRYFRPDYWKKRRNRKSYTNFNKKNKE